MSRRALAFAFLLAAVCSPARAQGRKERDAALWAKLGARVESVERGLDGVMGVFVRDLTSGATIEVRPNEAFPQASSIKVAVLYELYRQAEEGRVDLDEVMRPPMPRARGGGVLQELGDKASLTWRDLAVLMMGWSDNEATNVLIAKLGMDAVNRRLDSLGLPAVRLRRRMMDLEAARRGDENVGTPAEMARLMEHVYKGTGLSPARAKDLVAVAATPKDSPFRAPLPESLVVADKPGSLEGVRCVSAVVYLPGRPYVATIMTTYLKRDADGEAAVREVSAALYETFDRMARAGDYGRIISDR